VTQNGKDLFVGTLKAEEALDSKTISAAWVQGRGYQRIRNGNKVRNIDAFLGTNKGILPTALLIGVRDPGVKFKARPGLGGRIGVLRVPDSAILYVIDGQHRIEGLRSSQKSDEDNSELKKFGFPAVFICPSIWSKDVNAEIEEGKQFIIVNKTQTGVKGDLVNAFVYSLSMTSLGKPRPDLSGLPSDIERLIQPISTARNITLIIQYNDVWKNRINKPNEPRGKNVIGEKTMVDALLQYVVNKPEYASGGGPLAVRIGQYWQAIMNHYPAATLNPRNYWVQKGLGIAVFTLLFPAVDKLTDDKTADAYGRVLEAKAHMPLEEFWSRTGKARTMGSSYTARNDLAKQIWS